MGQVCISGGGGGRCRTPWLGGVPSEARHPSTSGLRASPTALPGSLSVAGRLWRPRGRRGIVSCSPPGCSCGSTSPVLDGHIPPKNCERPCGRMPSMSPPLLGRLCAATGQKRPWTPPPLKGASGQQLVGGGGGGQLASRTEESPPPPVVTSTDLFGAFWGHNLLGPRSPHPGVDAGPNTLIYPPPPLLK